jgi:hypothetical protein
LPASSISNLNRQSVFLSGNYDLLDCVENNYILTHASRQEKGFVIH